MVPLPILLIFENSTVGKKTFTTVTHLAEKFVVELTDFWVFVLLLHCYCRMIQFCSVTVGFELRTVSLRVASEDSLVLSPSINILS